MCLEGFATQEGNYVCRQSHPTRGQWPLKIAVDQVVLISPRLDMVGLRFNFQVSHNTWLTGIRGGRGHKVHAVTHFGQLDDILTAQVA